MDLLKGIAIFMVVMGHVLTMCIRDIDAATLFKSSAKYTCPSSSSSADGSHTKPPKTAAYVAPTCGNALCNSLFPW